MKKFYPIVLLILIACDLLPALPTPASQQPSATPRANSNCTGSIAPLFVQKWMGELAARIGCPSQNASSARFVQQIFEHGRMYYNEGERKIYVLADDKAWVAFDDSWTGDLPADSCPGVTVASPNIKAVKGFGKAWCENESVRRKLGAATSPEQGIYSTTLQRFEHGIMFGGYDSSVWVLVDGGRWE